MEKLFAVPRTGHHKNCSATGFDFDSVIAGGGYGEFFQGGRSFGVFEMNDNVGGHVRAMEVESTIFSNGVKTGVREINIVLKSIHALVQ